MTDLQQRLDQLAGRPAFDSAGVLRQARLRDRRQRRTVRTLLCAGGVSALAALLVALPQPRSLWDDPPTATLPDASRQEAHPPLSAAPQRIEATMIAAAERALGGLVAHAPARLRLLDDDLGRLPAARAGEATAASLEIGTPGSDHQWYVYAGPTVDLPGDPRALCGQRTSAPLLCSAHEVSDGVVVVRHEVLRRLPGRKVPGGTDAYSPVADPRQLSAEDLTDLRLEKRVALVRASGTSTTVVETVYAPGALDDSAFAATEEQLIALARDAALRWR